jgi:hypothetical protein
VLKTALWNVDHRVLCINQTGNPCYGTGISGDGVLHSMSVLFCFVFLMSACLFNMSKKVSFSVCTFRH